MPNIGGPKSKRRRLYNEVVHSILLYGAPVWADSMRVERTRLKLARVQRRSALRVASAYRTVSEGASLTVAGIPPIDLLAFERKRIYNGQPKDDARKLTFERWRERWNASPKGRWTHRLIPDPKVWSERGCGELSFHLTQVLTGHGCFGAYLKRIGKRTTEECHHCGDAVDDVEHTLFRCAAWTQQRTRLKEALGGDNDNEVSAEQMVSSMLQAKEKWLAWTAFATSVMRAKEEDDRSRRRASQAPQPSARTTAAYERRQE